MPSSTISYADANQPSYGRTTYMGSNNSDLILPDDYEFKGAEFDSHWWLRSGREEGVKNQVCLDKSISSAISAWILDVSSGKEKQELDEYLYKNSKGEVTTSRSRFSC